MAKRTGSEFRWFCAVAVLLPWLMAAAAHAQPTSASNPSEASGDMAGDVAKSSPEFVPKGLPLLTQHASWHTDVTFDRSMLAIAGKLEGLDEPTRQAIARLNAVTVHSYRYAQPETFDKAEVDSIRMQYDALGWKHIVTRHGKPKPDGTMTPGRTDIWVRMDGMNVAGVAVLLAEPSSLNLVAVSGDISTVDLLHLRGHFGIPKFDPDEMVK